MRQVDTIGLGSLGASSERSGAERASSSGGGSSMENGADVNSRQRHVCPISGEVRRQDSVAESGGSDRHGTVGATTRVRV